MRVRLLLFGAAAWFVMSGCGSGAGNSTPPPPPPQFTIGGSVSGLAGTGLVLQDNGGDNLSVSASGSFTFSTSVASGGVYKVTVLTQPSGPAQTCAVTNGSGTATANVTGVQVACTTVTHTIGGTVAALAGPGLVLLDNGGDNLSVDANGSFTFATAIADGGAYAVTISVQPSSPAQTCGVTNGMGTATANVTNVMVDCGHGEWTWMGGSKAANQSGTYGALGTPAPANIPGGRGGFANSWIDKSGNFWLFDGDGYDSTGTRDMLNDLWKYSNGEWTWVGGSDLVDQAGIYGTMGTPSPDNIPGGRNGGDLWTDASGNVWLFGGQGGTGGLSDFNDLWEYSSGEWTWMGGANVANQAGSYGTLGMPAASNIPGGRAGARFWTDASGNVWLFGGQDLSGFLSDLWKYSNGQWTWMSGPTLTNQTGTYGTLGTPNPGNIPGARWNPVTWIDAQGNLWLFGGHGYDSAGTLGQLNDLWRYEP